MTNGIAQFPSREEASLEAQLVASIPYVEAKRGKVLPGTPAPTPAPDTKTGIQEDHSRVTREMAAQLAAPLPPEAIDIHPTKAYLSTIRTIFSIERLNQVFGLDGWTYHTEIIENDPAKPMVVVKVTLYAGGIVREQYGGNDNPDRGDAYKGAVTDGLSKICSYLGIGMDVYKGRGPTKTNGGKRETARPAPVPNPKVTPPAPGPAASTSTTQARSSAKPWTTIGEMEEEFRKVEALLPPDYFGEILADHGVQKAEHFRRGPTKRMAENAEIALRCYQKLLRAAADYQALSADPTTYENFEATRGNL